MCMSLGDSYLNIIVFRPILPQTNWCGPQLGKAWVHYDHTKVLNINRAYSKRPQKKTGRSFTSSSPTGAAAVQGWRCVANTWDITRHSARARKMSAANGDRFRQRTSPALASTHHYPQHFWLCGCCMNADHRQRTVLSLLAKMRMRLSNSMLA